MAKYLKRQLKERNNDLYKEIDADLDEETVYTTTSTSAWSKKSLESSAKVIEKKESAPPAVAKEPVAKSRAIEVSDVAAEKEADGVDAPLFCEGGCIIS